MKRWWWVVSILVAAAVGVALVEYVNGDVVVALLDRARWFYVLWAIGVVTCLKLVEAVQFKIMVSRITDISLGDTILLYLASQAPVAVPGGVFFKAVLLQRETGTPLSAVTPVIIMQSALDYVLLITAAVIAALYFQRQGPWAVGAVVGLVLLVLVLSIFRVRRWLSEWVSGLIGSHGAGDRFLSFLTAARSLLSVRMVAAVTALAAVIFALDVAVLWLCSLAFGVVGNPLEVALVFAFPTVLGRLSGLPLGLGVLDVTMVGALRLLPQVDLNTAVVVVGVYRLTRHLLPVLVGALLYFLVWLPLWGVERSGRDPLG